MCVFEGWVKCSNGLVSIREVELVNFYLRVHLATETAVFVKSEKAVTVLFHYARYECVTQASSGIFHNFWNQIAKDHKILPYKNDFL